MLADRLTPPVPKFDAWLAGLRDDHFVIVHGWLTDTTFSANAVARAIRDDDPEGGYVGYRANHETIQNWRRNNGIG